MKELSRREKKLVMLAGGVIALFLLLRFGLFPLLDYYAMLDKRIPRLEKDVQKARLLRKLYLDLDRKVAEVRAKVDERHQTFNPYDFLDKLARKDGIRSALDKITSGSEEINEDYREEIVTIRLKGVTLNKLVRYLYDIEHSGQVLTVKSLSIEPDEENSMLLDVEFEVSTFSRNKPGERVKRNEKIRSRAGRRSR